MLLMQEEGCQPNVVTYNTLIDVYGKMGCWEEAVQVLDDMTNKVLCSVPVLLQQSWLCLRGSILFAMQLALLWV